MSVNCLETGLVQLEQDRATKKTKTDRFSSAIINILRKEKALLRRAHENEPQFFSTSSIVILFHYASQNLIMDLTLFNGYISTHLEVLTFYSIERATVLISMLKSANVSYRFCKENILQIQTRAFNYLPKCLGNMLTVKI